MAAHQISIGPATLHYRVHVPDFRTTHHLHANSFLRLPVSIDALQHVELVQRLAVPERDRGACKACQREQFSTQNVRHLSGSWRILSNSKRAVQYCKGTKSTLTPQNMLRGTAITPRYPQQAQVFGFIPKTPRDHSKYYLLGHSAPIGTRQTHRKHESRHRPSPVYETTDPPRVEAIQESNAERTTKKKIEKQKAPWTTTPLTERPKVCA